MFVTFTDPKTEEEREFELDLDDIDVQQAQYIKRHFKLTPSALNEGIQELDPDALVAVYWLMLKQNGITVDPAKTNFKLMKFAAAFMQAGLKEHAAKYGITVEELREIGAEANKRDVAVEDIFAERGIAEVNPTEAGSPT